jgi:hypothetical protein
MKIQVFDPPMCCSTGICGPSVDPELVRFAADLDWLKRQGVDVERNNLSQQPAAFAGTLVVKDAIAKEGNACLPLTVVDGAVVCKGKYPTREILAGFAGLELPSRLSSGSAKPPPAVSAVADQPQSRRRIVEKLPMVNECCGPSCACVKPPTHTRAKAAICVVVIVAVAVILIIKLTACSKPSAPVVTQGDPAQVVKSVGEPLAAFSDINTGADAKDTVFVLIPAPGDAGVKPDIAQSMQAAKKTLEAKNVSTGLYTLKADSPDYSSATLPQSLPWVLVMCKDRGKEMVSGEITESRLLQAYVAASRVGGCACNKGGGSSTCGGGQ